MNERGRGCVLGMAVGDALGTTYEFEVIDQPKYPALATGPATDVVGAGPFDLAAGAVTDDTQMAVCVARSLAAHGGELAPADVGARYVAWAKEAFDIGNQTHAAITRLAAGEDAREVGRRVWHASGRQAAGNGSLMRAAPLAVAYAARGHAELVEAAVAESLITHADPRCALACAAFAAAVAAGVNGGEPSMFTAARPAIGAAADLLATAWSHEDADVAAVKSAARELGEDLDAAQLLDPQVYGAQLHIHRTAGFVRVAFRLAFWHLVHTPSWRDAVVDVASRGGDADTNAAIVGALLGARDGEAAIPAAWRARVLGATLPGSAEWAEAHHPRHLLG